MNQRVEKALTDLAAVCIGFQPRYDYEAGASPQQFLDYVLLFDTFHVEYGPGDFKIDLRSAENRNQLLALPGDVVAKLPLTKVQRSNIEQWRAVARREEMKKAAQVKEFLRQRQMDEAFLQMELLEAV